MKIKEFKEQNIVFAKNQPEYRPLPALKLNTPDGQVVSCWGLSFRERIRVLFTGKIWVSLLTYNRPLQPQFISTKKSEHFKTAKNSRNKKL
jgi:hypothetical protein